MQFVLQHGDTLGIFLTGVGTIGLCLLALVPIAAFRDQQHTAKGQWLFRVFSNFYLNERFDELRALFEYNFEMIVAPVMEKSIIYPELLTSTEITLLRKVDTLLNYFEYVLFLEKNRFIERKYRNLIFSYWFTVMKQPSHVFLRDYLSYDFENLAAELNFPMKPKHYLAVYGTLSAEHGGPFAQEQLSSATHSKLVPSGEFRIKGTLYDFGTHPGFVQFGETLVRGQLLEIQNLEILHDIDRYEEYDPQRPGESLYVRRFVLLDEPAIGAWIYVYNGDVKGAPVVESGRWRVAPQQPQQSAQPEP
jgi:gamma-glutamylcyclotransferase (GGCT)/AIG2-like uncharacterized protein YtfP